LILKAINVTKKFDELKAVNDLSFEVHAGKIFGIAGPNGAGKSTVFTALTAKSSLRAGIFQACHLTVLPKPVLPGPFRFRKPFQASVYKKASPWAAASVPPADSIRRMWMR